MANYTLAQSGDTLKLTLSSIINPEGIEVFLKDYQSKVSKIDPSKTTLFVDASKMNIVLKDSQEGLKGAFMIYQKTGFKKVQMALGNNALLSMQVKRIAAEAGLVNFDIV